MKLVNVNMFGIKGNNYYWTQREKFNISQKELEEIRIENQALVDESLNLPLQKAKLLFEKLDYELIVKDAYRSPELYKLVKEKRYKIDARENTDKTLNHVKMPHATGKAVDVSLIDLKTGKEVSFWDKKDWPAGIFIDYYKNSPDNNFQELQNLLITNMLSVGFKLGERKEIWHFEFL